MKIYLVRHGKESDAYRGGWSDTGLTEEGKIQADELAEYFLKNTNSIKYVFTSDLKRAVETARPIADALNISLSKTANFREVNNGKLAGLKNDEADSLFPGLYWKKLGWDEKYPGGESPHMFYERIKIAWSNLIKNIDSDSILVTHGGVIQVILSIVNSEKYSNKLPKYKISNGQIITLHI